MIVEAVTLWYSNALSSQIESITITRKYFRLFTLQDKGLWWFPENIWEIKNSIVLWIFQFNILNPSPEALFIIGLCPFKPFMTELWLFDRIITMLMSCDPESVVTLDHIKELRSLLYLFERLILFDDVVTTSKSYNPSVVPFWGIWLFD